MNRSSYTFNFEFTAPDTPQQKGKVERLFATLFGRVRAMNTNAGLDATTRTYLWAEVANTCTKLHGILVPEHKQQSPNFEFYPSWARELRTFGEIGVVTRKANQTNKLSDRGFTAIFLGYSPDHAGNVYRLLNISTHKIITSRSIYWLNKTFGQYKSNKSVTFATKVEHIDDNDNESGRKITITSSVPPTPQINPKVL